MGRRPFLSCFPPFGARVGAFCAQRMAEALCHMAEKKDPASMHVFIDDFICIKPDLQSAKESADRLSSKMEKVGMVHATEKFQPPAQTIKWICFEFNSQEMTMKVPRDKIDETLQLVNSWRHKTKATRKELQQLLGKLNWVSHCVKPGRLFINRMLVTLREAYGSDQVTLSTDFREDLKWWATFLPEFNGVSFVDHPAHQHNIRVESCLSGAGGTLTVAGSQSPSEFYGTQYPEELHKEKWPISQLEALNCLAAIRLWAPQLARGHLRLQSGKGTDRFLLAVAREVWHLQALYQFTMSALHCPGREMTTPDALSRRHIHPCPPQVQRELASATETRGPWYGQRFPLFSNIRIRCGYMWVLVIHVNFGNTCGLWWIHVDSSEKVWIHVVSGDTCRLG